MEKWGDILNLEFSLKIQHSPREVPGVINVNIAEFLVEHWTMHWSWRKGVFWKWYQLSGDMKELGLIKLITKNANYRLHLSRLNIIIDSPYDIHSDIQMMIWSLGAYLYLDECLIFRLFVWYLLLFIPNHALRICNEIDSIISRGITLSLTMRLHYIKKHVMK